VINGVRRKINIMNTLSLNEMEMIEGGWKEPSCERAAGWLVSVGACFCFSGALLPLGIVIGGSGVAGAAFCASR
jgi:hypothetical protein